MGGGIAQAYTTMGFCTFMKTVEVTRHRADGVQQSSLRIASDILKREGIRGINKGVNAVGEYFCLAHSIYLCQLENYSPASNDELGQPLGNK